MIDNTSTDARPQAFMNDLSRIGPDAMALSILLVAVQSGVPRDALGCVGNGGQFPTEVQERIDRWVTRLQSASADAWFTFAELAREVER